MRVRSYIPKKYEDLFEKYRHYLEHKQEEQISTYRLVQLMVIKVLKEWSAEARVGPA